MNPSQPLCDGSGRIIVLDRPLGDTGGEGKVYALSDDPTLAAKLYHHPPTADKIDKLKAMVALANPNLLKLAAWPKTLLYHGHNREFAGFLMPRLIDCQPIQNLYNPLQRLKCFPRSGWAFQVRIAEKPGGRIRRNT